MEVRSDGTRLTPGKAVRLTVTGSYADANPLPVVFTVNGSACHAVVSGVSGGTAAGSGTAVRTAADAERVKAGGSDRQKPGGSGKHDAGKEKGGGPGRH